MRRRPNLATWEGAQLVVDAEVEACGSGGLPSIAEAKVRRGCWVYPLSERNAACLYQAS
jgi:hypothetical protein